MEIIIHDKADMRGWDIQIQSLQVLSLTYSLLMPTAYTYAECVFVCSLVCFYIYYVIIGGLGCECVKSTQSSDAGVDIKVRH